MAIVLPPDSAKSEDSPSARASSLKGWRLMAWIGLAFVVMGGTDIGLAWYPSGFGEAEWEFGAISATLNGFALPILGGYLMLSAAVARNSQLVSRIVATAMLAVALALLILAFIYMTVAPLALTSVADNQLLTAGIQKAIIKASILFVSYTALLVAGGVQGWRARTME